MAQHTMEQSYTVSAPARLKISNIRGSIDIRPGMENAIAITAIKHVDDGNSSQTEIKMEQDEDGSVRVETRFHQDFRNLVTGMKPCRVDYTVRVPPACFVKVSSVSSTTYVEGLTGDVDLSTVSGAGIMVDLNGPLRVNTVSGDIQGMQLNGSLHYQTVSGDLHLSDSKLSAVSGSSVSGDVRLETPLGDGPYRFEAVSGDVTLSVPGESPCTVRGKSLSGGFSATFNRERKHIGRGKWRVDLQGGGSEVYFSSVSGDLWLAGPENGVSDQPQERRLPVNRREVLERVAKGELSAEEGLQAIKS